LTLSTERQSLTALSGLCNSWRGEEIYCQPCGLALFC